MTTKAKQRNGKKEIARVEAESTVPSRKERERLRRIDPLGELDLSDEMVPVCNMEPTTFVTEYYLRPTEVEDRVIMRNAIMALREAVARNLGLHYLMRADQIQRAMQANAKTDFETQARETPA